MTTAFQVLGDRWLQQGELEPENALSHWAGGCYLWHWLSSSTRHLEENQNREKCACSLAAQKPPLVCREFRDFCQCCRFCYFVPYWWDVTMHVAQTHSFLGHWLWFAADLWRSVKRCLFRCLASYEKSLRSAKFLYIAFCKLASWPASNEQSTEKFIACRICAYYLQQGGCRLESHYHSS